jgi:poly(hydroxyalkanoate) granule-associated protein
MAYSVSEEKCAGADVRDVAGCGPTDCIQEETMSKAMRVTRRTAGTPQIRESAQRVWYAGLGALAMAEEEGGKMFKTLVKKGEGYERVNRARLDGMIEKVGDVRDGAEKTIGRSFNRLGVNVEDRMEPVLHRLGFPTRKEITTLSRRVEELTRSLEKKGRAPVKPAPRRVPRRAPRAAPATA